VASISPPVAMTRAPLPDFWSDIMAGAGLLID
jgi:hypothetical protein